MSYRHMYDLALNVYDKVMRLIMLYTRSSLDVVEGRAGRVTLESEVGARTLNASLLPPSSLLDSTLILSRGHPICQNRILL